MTVAKEDQVTTASSSPIGCIPGKKAILACMLISCGAFVLLLSGYTDVGHISSGRKWVESALGQTQRERVMVCEDCGRNVTSFTSSALNATQIASVAAVKTSEDTSKNGESKMKSPPALTESKQPDLGPGRTYMITKAGGVIECRDSPFVVCGGRPQRTAAEQSADRTKHPPYKVVSVRTAKWQPKFDFSKCNYNNCVYQGNTPLPDTDVVHIYGVNLKSSIPRPRRYGNQTWIFSVWESPYHTYADFLRGHSSVWTSVFNMTMSYKVDSDVFQPYSKLVFEPTPMEKRPNYLEIAKKKSKSVAWFVSNCRTPSRRIDYVRELKKYIDVDIFGACGKPCAKKNGKCWQDLPKVYKFYLSFENSLCTDYISEKLYKIFTPGMHVIPVTRGGTDYVRYFPKNTFIDAAAFKSPKELAGYLKGLGSDPARYAQMLEHKDQYHQFDGLERMWCSLCEVLNKRGLKHSTRNMHDSWRLQHCKAPGDIYG